MAEPAEPDRVACEALWRAYASATGLPPGEPWEAWGLGDSAEQADRLAELVVRGPKRATTGLLAEYEADGEAIGEVGGESVLVDGAGQPVCVLRTTEVRILPFRDVDVAYAWDEGEGDRSLASWRAEHEQFFRRACLRLGIAWHPGLRVVCERFAVVWPPDAEDG